MVMRQHALLALLFVSIVGSAAYALHAGAIGLAEPSVRPSARATEPTDAQTGASAVHARTGALEAVLAERIERLGGDAARFDARQSVHQHRPVDWAVAAFVATVSITALGLAIARRRHSRTSMCGGLVVAARAPPPALLGT